ncbi:MAG: hypothetical protein IJ861_10605, partial [Clostridia bacterium]|nr:hypothetical protein [Clostridia bacterium]
MIKVELTKNIFNQRGGGLFGLKPIQLVFAAVAVVVGGLTVLWLVQYDLSIDLIGWIVFIEMAIIIGLGVVRPGGVNLFSFLLSSLKPDTRYFCRAESLRTHNSSGKKFTTGTSLLTKTKLGPAACRRRMYLTMLFWKKNKIDKKFLGAKKAVIPKTAQKTIPFQEAYENGLFLNYDGSYSLIFSFENIDYSLFRDEEKQEVYKKYTQLMNSIPTDIKLQEFLMNTDIDTDILRETLMPFSSDYPEISDDYRKIMGDVISGSTDAGAKKIMLMALSYKPTGKIDNANVLFKCYQDLQQLFSSLGSTTNQLFPEEVFEILYKFYHQFSEVPFMLSKNAYGSRIKNYVTPAYFRFGKHEIEIGDQLTRVLFIKEYSTYVDDEMINDIIDNSEKITVSKQITRIAKSQAMDMLQKKIFALELTIQKRMEQNHKTGGDYIPYRLSDERKNLNQLQERLGGSECELFEVAIFIAVSAKTKEELEELTLHIRQTIGAKHQLQIETLGGQQAKALQAVLPFAQMPFSKKNDNKISFPMLSDAAGVLIPFNHIDHFVKNGVYYGKNLVTQNVIALDRTAEMNSNGFVLATSGAGKSMFSKAEMFDVLLKFPEDEVIVIDPEREYEPLVKEFDGT